MISHFAASDGRRLAFHDSGGEGPPVLCLAGLTRNSADYETLARHLAARYRVIRLDSRGRGASDFAEQPIMEYTVPVETGDALALLDHLDIARAAIIGTSRGGILGMALATGARERVQALVLNDVGAVIEMRGLLRIFATIGREPKAESFEAAAAELAHQNRREFPEVPIERWVEHARAIYRDDGGRPRLSYDPHLRSATAVALDTDLPVINLWPMVDAMKDLPVLLLRGERSDILTAETAIEMTRHLPRLRYVEVAGRGHAPFLDEAEAVAAIDAFLEEYT